MFAAFRGTQSLEDWLSNFTFPQIAHPWGQAEQGFTDLYNQCSIALKAALQHVMPAPSIIVTGHSLGAALAALAAADLVNSNAAPGAGMYTFAGPRVGDLAFAAQFNRRVAIRWRIVNTEDIVTTVPLAIPELSQKSQPHNALGIALTLAHNLNYEHVGIAVSFTAHAGSIAGNHAMQIYLDELNAS